MLNLHCLFVMQYLSLFHGCSHNCLANHIHKVKDDSTAMLLAIAGDSAIHDNILCHEEVCPSVSYILCI